MTGSLFAGWSGATPAQAAVRTSGQPAAVRFSAAPPAPVPVGTMAVWVSPAGSDTNNGVTPSAPFRTLQRASDFLCGSTTSCPGRGQPVVVKVAQTGLPQVPLAARVSAPIGDGGLAPRVTGTVATVWRYLDPGFPTSIEPWSYVDGDGWPQVAAAGGYPTFDGALNVDFGLVVQPQVDLGPRDTRLTLRYLRWSGFTIGAVQLAGGVTSRVTPAGVEVVQPTARTVNGVTFYGCSFTRVGNFWKPALPLGYGAVLPINSSRVVIRNNHFITLRNTLARSDSIHMHGIYLTHGSQAALIEGNEFTDITGDPVRQRDASHGALVQGNRFTRAGAFSYFNDYYCRPDTPRAYCFPKEFRSRRGVLTRNRMDGFYPQGITGRRLVWCHDQPRGLCPADRIAVR